MDREGKEPLALLDEIEQELGMPCVPMTWPVGQGKAFGGIVDLRKQQMRLFKAGADKRSDEGDEIVPLSESDQLHARFGHDYEHAEQHIELLAEAAPAFDEAAFVAAKQTPVFFGSGVNNFGVQEVLDALVDLAPPARRAPRDAGRRQRPRGAAAVAGLLGRGVQGAGQHGPFAPRPHRLRARQLRPLRRRHEAARAAHRQGAAPDLAW